MMASTSNDVRSVRVRKYGPLHSGPFIVIAESATEFLDTAKLSKQVIKDFGNSYVKGMSMSRKKIKILMRNAEAANALVMMNYPQVKMNIPQRLVECLGVADIGGVEDEDLPYVQPFEKPKLMQINNPIIVEARRMIRKTDTGTKPLSLVVFTFEGHMLPSHVELDNALYQVRKYNYSVRQCRRCWCFGHSGTQCKSKQRCQSCRLENPERDHACIGGPVCVNCSGEHRADDRNKCPQFAKKKDEEQKRQSSFSQGKTDWFAELASNPMPSTSMDNRTKNKRDAEVVDEHSSEQGVSNKKNRSIFDISDDEQFPEMNNNNARVKPRMPFNGQQVTDITVEEQEEIESIDDSERMSEEDDTTEVPKDPQNDPPSDGLEIYFPDPDEGEPTSPRL